MKTYTNNTPGMRGVTVNTDNGPVMHWLDPGKSIELDPKLVLAVPDLGGDKPALATAPVDNEALDAARREGVALAMTEIEGLKANHAEAFRAESERADKAEEDLDAARTEIEGLKAKLEAAAGAPNDIKDAIDLLDPKNDDHWTKAGEPAVDAVKEILGRDVSRADIDAAAPGFVRPAA